MIETEEIKTIKKSADNKFKEKSSLFLSKSFCITIANEAEEILSRLRKEYFDATHHCYAYRLNTRKSTDNFKYSDDGEPSGTAGIRILNA
ncbi:MAG: YigZ family protein, partial [Ignavibacteriaceae bacterium]|nr:YigZ family protein [Ignavibacteriaceae bacterium]